MLDNQQQACNQPKIQICIKLLYWFSGLKGGNKPFSCNLIYNQEKFAEKYFAFVSHQRDIGGYKELKKKLPSAIENEYVSGREVILRDLSPSKVISFISGKLMLGEKRSIEIKAQKKHIEFRAFSAYILRVLCRLGYKEICCNIHNMTISGCSRLCSKGHDLLNKPVFSEILDELISVSKICLILI